MYRSKAFYSAAMAMAVAMSLGGAAIAQQPYKIGLSVEVTGAGAGFGPHMQIDAEIAKDEINAAGGVNGHPIEFVIEDNQTKPELAVSAVRNLARAGVVGIIGPLQTNQARVAFSATNREKLVSLTPGSNVPGLAAENRPYAFRNSALLQVITDDMVAQVRKDYPNAKRVVMVTDPKDAIQKFFATVAAPPALTAAGFEIVNKDSYIEIPYTDQDFSVHVTKIKALQPDVVLLSIFYDRGVDFLKEAIRQGLKTPVITPTGWILEPVARAAGDIVVYCGTSFDPYQDDAHVKAFNAEFKKRVEARLPGQYTLPAYYDAGAYETVYMFADVLKKSGLKPDADVQALRSALRDGLQSMKDFPGLGNKITINQEGDAIKPTLIYKTNGGQWARAK